VHGNDGTVKLLTGFMWADFFFFPSHHTVLDQRKKKNSCLALVPKASYGNLERIAVIRYRWVGDEEGDQHHHHRQSIRECNLDGFHNSSFSPRLRFGLVWHDLLEGSGTTYVDD